MPTDKQRREAERRRLKRQLERRREQAAKRHRNNLIASVVGAVVIIALVVLFIVRTGGENSSTAAGGGCTWTKSGTAAKKVSVPSTTTPSRKGTVALSVATTQGAMSFTLNRAAAPCAVASFVSLAAQKYFDSTPCHRLTSGGLSVLQCGDPSGTGSGGPGYSFADELTGKEKYTRGVLAMANSGVNTNGSQFFIVYRDSDLGPKYTVFGKVSKGLSVVDKVAAGGSTPASDGKPKLPITLTKVQSLS